MSPADKYQQYQECQKWGHSSIIVNQNSEGPYTCNKCGTRYTIKIEITELNSPTRPARKENEEWHDHMSDPLE